MLPLFTRKSMQKRGDTHISILSQVNRVLRYGKVWPLKYIPIPSILLPRSGECILCVFLPLTCTIGILEITVLFEVNTPPPLLRAKNRLFKNAIFRLFQKYPTTVDFSTCAVNTPPLVKDPKFSKGGGVFTSNRTVPPIFFLKI